MSLGVLVILVLGQLDGGVSAPPPPPDVPGEEVSLPRVLRRDGQVCVQALDASGAVTLTCRRDGSPAGGGVRPARPPPDAGPELRGVVGLGVGLGMLTGDKGTLPELSFMLDAGFSFPNGSGVVALLHGHLNPLFVTPAGPALLQRYGVGGALRLGDRSHLLLGVTATLVLVQALTLEVTPAFSVVMKGALALNEHVVLLLMPVFGFDQGVIFSMTAGVGAVF